MGVRSWLQFTSTTVRSRPQAHDTQWTMTHSGHTMHGIQAVNDVLPYLFSTDGLAPASISKRTICTGINLSAASQLATP